MQALIRREDKQSEELGSTGDEWRCCCFYEDQVTKAIIAKAFFSAKNDIIQHLASDVSWLEILMQTKFYLRVRT